MKNLNKFVVLGTMVLMLIMTACSDGSEQAKDNQGNDASEIDGLPNQMAWSVYDVGSGGYAEATAIADSLTKVYGSQIRLLPSSSGVGRINPLKAGDAVVGRLGDEAQFAYEALYEFAEKSWGPDKDLRVVWTPYSFFGLTVLEKSDIDTIEDLKGKKVPFIVGNDSINIKTEVMLAFGGLTWDDVEVVELSEYGTQGDALKQGQIEVASMLPSSSVLYELDTLDGIRWLEMPADDESGWEAVQEIAPWLLPGQMDNGAGMSEENPVEIMGYAYSMYTYEDTDPEIVYSIAKALDDTFDNWKDSAANLENWSKDNIVVEPLGVPMHEGFIKFLEENELWTEEYDEKNEALIERGKLLKETWDEVVAESEEEGISDADFPKYWLDKKEELMD